MSRKIDVYMGEEIKEIDSDSEFFNNVKDVDNIEECYVLGNTLEVIYKNRKPTLYYEKVHGSWGFPVRFK